MSKVSLVRVESYNDIEQKIKEAIDLLGGISNFVKKDAKVFIKLNLIGPFGKDTGITTRPDVLESVIKLVKTQTDDITIGDNPAAKDVTFVLKKNGCFDLIEKYNLKLIDGKDEVIINNPNPHIYSNFEVSRDYVTCDTLINLPKIKCHTLTYMTCAEKNFFGLIYGLKKATWHSKATNPLEFGEALNDLYGAFLHAMKEKIILNIADGVIGLDGDGPSTGGTPKPAKCIIASADAVSVDTIACKVVKLDLNRIFVTNIAKGRGYGDGDNIELLGNSLDDFDDIKFDGPRDTLSSIGLRIIRHKFIRNFILEHPKIDHNKCIKCGECAKICPAKTMKIEKGKFPHLRSTDCIRCWCCAEVCPQNAISKTKRPLIGKIFL